MFYRFILDLAVPEAVFNSIPAARKQALRDEIRALKGMAVNINAGKGNEENTTRAVWHKCHHDTGDQPCEAEQDILTLKGDLESLSKPQFLNPQEGSEYESQANPNEVGASRAWQ